MALLSPWLGVALLGLLQAFGCRKAEAPPPPVKAPHTLDAAEVVRLFPEEVADADGWARDLLRAFSAAGIPADAERVCGAVAILQQESGFQVDPPVPGLADMVRKRLDELAGKLGPPGKSAVQRLLAERRPGDSRTFAQRIGACIPSATWTCSSGTCWPPPTPATRWCTGRPTSWTASSEGQASRT